MEPERIKFTLGQSFILLMAMIVVACAGFFVAVYFKFGVAASIAWFALSIFSTIFLFMIGDTRRSLRVRQATKRTLIVFCLFLVGIAFIHTPFFDGFRKGISDGVADTSSSKTAKSPTCSTTAQCEGERNEATAERLCALELEKQAIAVRWTSQSILPLWAEDKQYRNRLTYYGDKGEFQIDSGQYQQWSYYCSYDYERGVVMDSGLILPVSLDKLRKG